MNGFRAGPHKVLIELAALLVVERDGGYAGLSDSLVDLRVDEHERPLEELRRIYALHQAIFGKTPPEDWLEVDPALAEELRELMARIVEIGSGLRPAFPDNLPRIAIDDHRHVTPQPPHVFEQVIGPSTLGDGEDRVKIVRIVPEESVVEPDLWYQVV